MQTFLPYPSFEQSAKCLDIRRLGKQRVECLQILNALAKGEKSCKICGNRSPMFTTYHVFCKSENRLHKIVTTPWYNHPAVQMWKGKEWNLCRYGAAMCDEWVRRGFRDTCHNKILLLQINWQNQITEPAFWLRDKESVEKVSLSHKSNLIRKNPDYYRPIFGNDIPDDLPYWWPTKQLDNE